VIAPFLKWAGGKRQLLPILRLHYPSTFTRYIEPFLGSGAVFFDLCALGRLEGRRVELYDVNPDLIGCYQAVRDRTAAVITALDDLAREHEARGIDCYYDVRDNRYTPARRAARGYTPSLAAMFIYLNRTGFNGLFRLNRSGLFNVPAGRYDKPRICDREQLRVVAAALQAPGVTLEQRPFDYALARAKQGDFVYCDPPYAPLSRTASFAHYTAGGFTTADQVRLHQAIVDAASRGARLTVSHSSAPEIVKAYGNDAARRAGLLVQSVPARRAINSRASSRGPVDELIISNAKLKMAKMPARRQQSRRASGS
jgi:DNA adenine methylase